MKNTYEIIIWHNQAIIDQYKTTSRRTAIKWIKDKGYRDMKVGVEIQVNGEMIDPITEEELGF